MPTRFATWAPKVAALIGKLPATIHDRTIVIEMKRKLPHERIEPLPIADDPFVELRRRAARWVEDNIESLRGADTRIPSELHDRAADNWRPLFAIADAVGGDWPAWARDAAKRLFVPDDDSEALGIQLLADLKQLFEVEGDRLSSPFIADELGKLEDRPWIDFHRDKPITPAQVARLLKPFGIRPRKVTIDERQVRGYNVNQFRSTFKRYLGVVQEDEAAPVKKGDGHSGGFAA